MYTKEYNYLESDWGILDTEGDRVCFVRTEEEADILLPHLNRD